MGSAPAAHCEDPIRGRGDAVRRLLDDPACADSAITALEQLSKTDGAAMNDLAGAYFLRAQANDQPSDLLRSLDAAEHAVAAKPQPAGARFNRALALEALSLTSEAIEAWSELAKSDRSPWGDEARTRSARLRSESARIAATAWPMTRGALLQALRAGDSAAVTRLVAPFPTSAQRLLEDDLIPDSLSSAATFGQARLLASALSRVTGDRYAVDLIRAIDIARSDPPALSALSAGHIAYRDARHAPSGNLRRKATLYRDAARLLRRGGSPLFLYAELLESIAARQPERLDAIEVEARRLGCIEVAAWTESTRAYYLFFGSRYVEALDLDNKALTEFSAVHDPESIATIRTRLVSAFRTLGDSGHAWREAFQALHDAPSIAAVEDRHAFLGETALTALEAGHATIALQYQSEAVRLIQDMLRATAPERLDEIRDLQRNLSIALRSRAELEVRVDRYDAARGDLAESVRLMNQPSDTDRRILRALQARASEAEGQLALPFDPNRAASAFTDALASSGDQYRSFRAFLYAERADAERRAGKRDAAEHDLRASLAELHTEEETLLDHRRRGEAEDIWSSYFSRFRPTYHLLIRQLVEEGRLAEAFDYGDRQHAFEPLTLALRSRGSDEVMDRRRVQALLPSGTFVIEYSVDEDRTYAWILWHDGLRAIALPVRRATIDRWSEALARAARNHDEAAFDTGLFAPYEALIAPPLAAIAALRQANPRLVFVPDGSLRGVPFAALRNPLTRRYLIQDAPVEIAPSAALYAISLQRDRELAPAQQASALLIGDPAFDRRLPIARSLQRLPNAGDEVRRIDALYRPHTVVRTGIDATVAEFLRRAPESSVIHIGAHAIVDSNAPSRSCLLLAPSAGNSGVLNAEDLLLRTRFDHARLVVLGACSSAGGLPVGPEGVAPLVRPLIAAGVPAVVGTLWDVQDATATELLVSFHRHYRNGSDAAVALQRAQLDLLSNPNRGLRSVLAWASFEVIGHGSSPFAASR